MNAKDSDEFIEIMHDIGDEWTPEQVADVYGDNSIDEALSDRKSSLSTFFNIIETVLNKE